MLCLLNLKYVIYESLNFIDLFYAVLMSFKVKINKAGVIECVFLKAILTLN